MKKWLIGFIAVAILLVASIYLFIPSTKVVSASTPVKASHAAALRIIGTEDGWKQWWPGTHTKASDTFTFHERNFYIDRKMFQSVAVTIGEDGDADSSLIVLLPVRRDSFEIEWKSTMQLSGNPFDRISDLQTSKKLQSDLQHLVDSFANFMETTSRVYGIQIDETIVKDSIILVSSLTFSSPPSISQIYSQVNKLKNFAAQHNAQITNHPMLNVDSVAGKYLLRVGLPVNKELDVAGTDMTIKRMVLGYILVAEVTGGPYAIREGLTRVEQYIADFNRRSPAIPYQSLVTDRITEPDTSNWVTRIYYPVY